jgi:serine kinase of HPr protein (carbohydrate metabolism regulator)
MSGQSLHLHASVVALGGRGVLLRGPSGAGKSDLALRLIAAGATLVADDQVALQARDGALWAAPPPALAGLLEVRGLGIVRLPHAPAALALLVDLVPAMERLPAPRRETLLGVALPVLAVAPFHASAAALVGLAVAAPPSLAGALGDAA